MEADNVHGIRARRRRAQRLLMALAIAAGLFGSSAGAAQQHTVCATLSYEVMGGPKQYVLNNECYVPTTAIWSVGEGQCALDPSIVRVCFDVRVRITPP